MKQISDKIDKEVAIAKKDSLLLSSDLSARLDTEVKMIYKALARNKSDTDAKHNTCINQRVDHKDHLSSHNQYLSCIAKVVTVMIENLNI